jgi:hypothetical protein
MTDSAVLFAFLPWLELREPVALGRFRFETFREPDVERSNWDGWLRAHVAQLMKQHVSIKGSPKGSITVITLDGEPVIRGVHNSPQTKAQIFDACQLIAMAAISQNSVTGTTFGYANAAVFRPFFQEGTDLGGTWLSFTFMRKFFSLNDMGYKSGEVKFTCPAWAHGIREVAVDTDILNALYAVDQQRHLKRHRRVLNAIKCFLLSYTDELWTVDYEDAALGLRAIDVLLQGMTDENPRQREMDKKKDPQNAFELKEVLADRLEVLLGLKPERNNFKANAKRKIPQFVRRPNYPALWNWFVDLYRLRNAVHHEGEAAETVWTAHEHTQIAAQVFVVALQHALKELGHLKPARNFSQPIQVIEKVLCDKEWWKEDDGNGTVWSRAMHEVALSGLADIIGGTHEANDEP